MSLSLTFNSIDLGNYGLIVNHLGLPVAHSSQPIQLRDRSFASDSFKTPAEISTRVAITGGTRAAIFTSLDNIRMALNSQEDETLAFDAFVDRYWLARFDGLKGAFTSPLLWEGELTFLAFDPLAFATSLTTVAPVAVDADPFTLPVTTLGTGLISPIFTLTSNDAPGAATITLENDATGDVISWVGTLIATDDLEIDVEHWLVKKTTVASMATVTGVFPRLLPAQVNNIIVTGFHTGTHGTIGLTYRNRFV